METFTQLSKTTACRLWSISTALFIISISCAQNPSIHSDAELAPFTTVNQEIGTEVVQTLSTRGNCECASVGVISKINQVYLKWNKVFSNANKNVPQGMKIKKSSSGPADKVIFVTHRKIILPAFLILARCEVLEHMSAVYFCLIQLWVWQHVKSRNVCATWEIVVISCCLEFLFQLLIILHLSVRHCCKETAVGKCIFTRLHLHQNIVEEDIRIIGNCQKGSQSSKESHGICKWKVSGAKRWKNFSSSQGQFGQ